MWLTLPSRAPSSRHHLLIQFPLKNNGFNEGGNKIFRNFVKFCKIITPKTGRLPCLPPQINASRTILQTSNSSWICLLPPPEVAHPRSDPGHQLGMGPMGVIALPPGCPLPLLVRTGLGGEEGGEGLAAPRPGQSRSQTLGRSSLSWLPHDGPLTVPTDGS